MVTKIVDNSIFKFNFWKILCNVARSLQIRLVPDAAERNAVVDLVELPLRLVNRDQEGALGKAEAVAELERFLQRLDRVLVGIAGLERLALASELRHPRDGLGFREEEADVAVVHKAPLAAPLAHPDARPTIRDGESPAHDVVIREGVHLDERGRAVRVRLEHVEHEAENALGRAEAGQ